MDASKPGLYNINKKMIYTWEELKENDLIEFDKGILYSTHDVSGILVLDKEVKRLEDELYELEEIYINKECHIISKDSIGFETKLKTIHVDVNNPNYSSENGILFNKDKTKLIRYPAKIDKKYIVPKSVTEIEEAAFCNNYYLEEIILHDNIKQIGASAFASTAIKQLTLPSKVTEIKKCLFYSCDYIQEFIIPRNITCIGERAFQNCNNLQKICIGSNVETIEGAIFSCCYNLKSIKYQGSKDRFIKIKNYKNIFDGNNLKIDRIQFEKTLDELIAAGHSLREANKILKERSKNR